MLALKTVAWELCHCHLHGWGWGAVVMVVLGIVGVTSFQRPVFVHLSFDQAGLICLTSWLELWLHTKSIMRVSKPRFSVFLFSFHIELSFRLMVRKTFYRLVKLIWKRGWSCLLHMSCIMAQVKGSLIDSQNNCWMLFRPKLLCFQHGYRSLATVKRIWINTLTCCTILFLPSQLCAKCFRACGSSHLWT